MVGERILALPLRRTKADAIFSGLTHLPASRAQIG